MIRWIRFNVVGAAGFAVQVVLLAALLRGGVHYLIATALAVEAAVVHNFVWHERWTWRDRMTGGRADRLWRFHLLNGVVSLIGNVALMWLLVGAFGVPVVPANGVAVLVCSTLNFAAGHKLVWVSGGSEDPPYQRE
jgi:putative flippase GtrA